MSAKVGRRRGECAGLLSCCGFTSLNKFASRSKIAILQSSISKHFLMLLIDRSIFEL
jgi:hypothetical protein